VQNEAPHRLVTLAQDHVDGRVRVARLHETRQKPNYKLRGPVPLPASVFPFHCALFFQLPPSYRAEGTLPDMESQ
jgi:hypothetical protein